MSTRPIVMQLILTIIALLSVERVIARARARAIGRALAAMWCVGAGVFLVCVWRPDLSTRLSNFFGIGRGVDAAMYVAVTLLFYIVLRMYLKLEQQENHLTTLVSEIALVRHGQDKQDKKDGIA